jgi:anti-anti-sigma factor
VSRAGAAAVLPPVPAFPPSVTSGRSKFERCEWRSELPATLEAIERFCGDFRVWRAASCADLDLFVATLLLREVLTNALVHGCREDPRRHISLVLRVKPGRLVVAVRDEGEGFDWRAEWNRQADVADCTGRGMEILRLYADSVRFSRRGNQVTLVKFFEGRKLMNDEIVSRDVTAATVKPAATVKLEEDLVAAKLPALRSRLREMTASGIQHLTLDLADVQAVDSTGIGLLVSAHNSLKKAGGELAVIHASKDILELFRTMRIHQHFSVSGN